MSKPIVISTDVNQVQYYSGTQKNNSNNIVNASSYSIISIDENNENNPSETPKGLGTKIKEGAQFLKNKVANGARRVKNAVAGGGRSVGNGVADGAKSVGGSLKRNTINVFLPESFIEDKTSRNVRDGMGNKRSLQPLKRSEIRHTDAGKVAALEKMVGLTISTADVNEFLYVDKNNEYTKNEENALRNTLADIIMKQGEEKGKIVDRKKALKGANQIINFAKENRADVFYNNEIVKAILPVLKKNKHMMQVLNLMLGTGKRVSTDVLQIRAGEASLNEKEIKKYNDEVTRLKDLDEEDFDKKFKKINEKRAKEGLPKITRSSLQYLDDSKTSFFSRTKHVIVNDIKNAWNVGSVVARTPMALAQVPMNALGLMNSGPEKLVTSILGTAGLVAKPFIAITALTTIVAARILGKVVKAGLYAAAAVVVAGLILAGIVGAKCTLLVGPTVGKIYDKRLDKFAVTNLYIELNQMRDNLEKDLAKNVSRKDPRLNKIKGLIKKLDREIKRLEIVLKTLGVEVPTIPHNDSEQIIRQLLIDRKIDRNTIDSQGAKIDKLQNTVESYYNSSYNSIMSSENFEDIGPYVEEKDIDDTEKLINHASVLLQASKEVNNDGKVSDEVKNSYRGKVAGGIRKGYKKLQSYNAERELAKLNGERNKILERIKTNEVLYKRATGGKQEKIQKRIDQDLEKMQKLDLKIQQKKDEIAGTNNRSSTPIISGRIDEDDFLFNNNSPMNYSQPISPFGSYGNSNFNSINNNSSMNNNPFVSYESKYEQSGYSVSYEKNNINNFSNNEAF